MPAKVICPFCGTRLSREDLQRNADLHDHSHGWYICPAESRAFHYEVQRNVFKQPWQLKLHDPYKGWSKQKMLNHLIEKTAGRAA